MREVRKRSVIPIYGTAGVIALYCLVFPVYRLSHLIMLTAAAVAAFIILSKLCPDSVRYIEEEKASEETYPPEIQALLNEGGMAISEMRRIRASVKDEAMREKIDKLMTVTGKIFDDLKDDPDDLPAIRRFSSYFLPATIKLLNAYDRMYAQGIQGQNISSSMSRISDILDTTIEAYERQLDALFGNQALDIETDISVLETMLKKEGLSEGDF